MLRATVEKVSPYIPGTEANSVKKFLENSVEFQKMRRLSLKSKTNSQMPTFVKDISHATTFSQILESLERFDFENTNDPTVKKIGRFGMNTILFFGGFVNNEANFAYLALHLREKVLTEMAQLGYTKEHRL